MVDTGHLTTSPRKDPGDGPAASAADVEHLVTGVDSRRLQPPPVRAFFLLAWPTPGVWWVIALMAGLAVGGIELVHLVRRRIVRGRG